MSTKAIRDVLETVAAGKPLSEDAPEVARRALAELTAIREAARSVVTEDGDWGYADAPAWDVLRAIAKED